MAEFEKAPVRRLKFVIVHMEIDKNIQEEENTI
jgi:hypothetical protein